MPRVSKNPGIPLEDDEAMAFHQWLEANHIPHSHIANEIGGSTTAAKVRALKAKKMGQTAGVWDYEIFLPVANLIDGKVDTYQEIRIELKRIKGSTVSPAQKAWGEIYKKAGIPCAICKGCEEAVKFVREQLATISGEDY